MTTDPMESLAAALRSGKLATVRAVLARFPLLESKLDEPVLFVIAEREQLRAFLKEHYPVPNFMQQYAEELR